MLKWLKQGPKEAKVYPLLLLRHVLQLQQLHLRRGRFRYPTPRAWLFVEYDQSLRSTYNRPPSEKRHDPSSPGATPARLPE